MNVGYAVCEGSFDLFEKLYMAEGIICKNVNDGVVRQWNIIMVDGKWYYAYIIPESVIKFKIFTKTLDNNLSIVGINSALRSMVIREQLREFHDLTYQHGKLYSGKKV